MLFPRELGKIPFPGGAFTPAVMVIPTPTPQAIKPQPKPRNPTAQRVKLIPAQQPAQTIAEPTYHVPDLPGKEDQFGFTAKERKAAALIYAEICGQMVRDGVSVAHVWHNGNRMTVHSLQQAATMYGVMCKWNGEFAILAQSPRFNPRTGKPLR